ncbi:unnamed protein product [Dovyalis caffra]|uniref:Uncharacterized protein n=1 Tax=Dovyalis caffra TaxID=77055 RepID=A0AAV1SFT3_9ROSI|nr:unnamed protein product [Dovyalis caffra]
MIGDCKLVCCSYTCDSTQPHATLSSLHPHHQDLSLLGKPSSSVPNKALISFAPPKPKQQPPDSPMSGATPTWLGLVTTRSSRGRLSEPPSHGIN